MFCEVFCNTHSTKELLTEKNIIVRYQFIPLFSQNLKFKRSLVSDYYIVILWGRKFLENHSISIATKSLFFSFKQTFHKKVLKKIKNKKLPYFETVCYYDVYLKYTYCLFNYLCAYVTLNLLTNIIPI